MILLVQNHDVLRYASAEILRDAGYTVHEAADGPEAMEMLKAQRFKLLITDTLLPQMSGFALAARARSQQPELPVVLTGYTRYHGAESLLQAPIDFLQKPIEASGLVAAVKRFV